MECRFWLSRFDRLPTYTSSMDREAAEILERVVRLPKEARAALADSLLESLDADVDEDVEESWRDEIQSRMREIDSGAVRLTSWNEAQKRLETRLKG